jgi:Fe-S cluster biogenesis protein NfuA
MTTAAPAVEVDRAELDARIEQVNQLMKTHAGAIELADVSPSGVVTVRFVAMCQGCPFRAVTLLGTIVPAILELPGVTDVHALGVRVSEEAAERLRAAMGESHSWLPGTV